MTDTIMRKVTEDEILKEKAIARDKFLHWQASIERQRKRQEAEKAELVQRLAELTEQQAKLVEQQAEFTEQQAEFAETKRQLKKVKAEKYQIEMVNNQTNIQLKRAIQTMAATGMSAEQIVETIGITEAEVERYLS